MIEAERNIITKWPIIPVPDRRQRLGYLLGPTEKVPPEDGDNPFSETCFR
jgi:hypothetical protein